MLEVSCAASISLRHFLMHCTLTHLYICFLHADVVILSLQGKCLCQCIDSDAAQAVCIAVHLVRHHFKIVRASNERIHWDGQMSQIYLKRNSQR